MTLSFKTRIGNDFTFFIQRIWLGLILDLDESYNEYYKQYIQKLGNNWHIATSIRNPKIHTIRADPKNSWQKGKNIHFVINNRTPNRFQFAPTLPVKAIQKIEIKWLRGYGDKYKKRNGCTPDVYIDDELFFSPPYRNYLGEVINNVDRGMLILANNDGFDSVDSFFKYFNTDFEGKIIHWTDFIYS